jgi:hypothetical protein
MNQCLRIFITCLLLLFCLTNSPIRSQIFKDTASLNMVKRGVDYIYNFQFNKADDVYKKISQVYPEHPVVFLFKGMKTYWENYPLLPSSPSRATFEKDLRSCIELCENSHKPDVDTEYLLANLCARGLLLLFYDENGLTMDVLQLVPGTYQYLRRSFDLTSSYSDFLYFTGLYNYYREAYPEAYPVYKPLALFFPEGDKLKGLKDLQIAASTSIELKAESLSILSWICISFENNYPQAVYFSKTLHDLYPDNPEYFAQYIKTLLLVKQYDEAERQISSFDTSNKSPYYQALSDILTGILKEKRHHDFVTAQLYYNNGIKNIEPYGAFGNEFASFAYFGLSRISDANADKNSRKIYRKKALELASFKKVNFDD